MTLLEELRTTTAARSRVLELEEEVRLLTGQRDSLGQELSAASSQLPKEKAKVQSMLRHQEVRPGSGAAPQPHGVLASGLGWRVPLPGERVASGRSSRPLQPRPPCTVPAGQVPAPAAGLRQPGPGA